MVDAKSEKLHPANEPEEDAPEEIRCSEVNSVTRNLYVRYMTAARIQKPLRLYLERPLRGAVNGGL
jgi:hypothetical protein